MEAIRVKAFVRGETQVIGRSVLKQWVALSVCVAFVMSCKESSSTPPPESESDLLQAQVLSAAGSCTFTELQRFQTQVQTLKGATTALASTPSAETQAAAKEAFRQAMRQWQRLEVMRWGPAAARTAPGGQDLREPLYSWPLINRCAMEELVVSQAYQEPSFSRALVNRRGLGALEYLLFYEGEDTVCSASSAIVSSGSWAALSTDERAARKRAYADAAAADLLASTETLVNAWAPEDGNFLNTVATAGAGNATLPSQQLALNALSDALFYVESDVKDMKLARPLGLRDCETGICPEALESLYAGQSKAEIKANVVGFRQIFEGCGADHAGLGFDDLLEARGAHALALSMRAHAIELEAAIDAIGEEDLALALSADKASVRKVYDELKDMTDILKTEFVSVLDLELPMSLEGDND